MFNITSIAGDIAEKSGVVCEDTNHGVTIMLKKESDDAKIAPIVMDTVRPEGRDVGMESGTRAEERDGDALLEKNEKE